MITMKVIIKIPVAATDRSIGRGSSMNISVRTMRCAALLVIALLDVVASAGTTEDHDGAGGAHVRCPREEEQDEEDNALLMSVGFEVDELRDLADSSAAAPEMEVGDGAGTAPSAVVDVEDAVRNADTEMEVGVEWGKFLL